MWKRFAFVNVRFCGCTCTWIHHIFTVLDKINDYSKYHHTHGNFCQNDHTKTNAEESRGKSCFEFGV